MRTPSWGGGLDPAWACRGAGVRLAHVLIVARFANLPAETKQALNLNNSMCSVLCVCVVLHAHGITQKLTINKILVLYRCFPYYGVSCFTYLLIVCLCNSDTRAQQATHKACPSMFSLAFLRVRLVMCKFLFTWFLRCLSCVLRIFMFYPCCLFSACLVHICSVPTHALTVLPGVH